MAKLKLTVAFDEYDFLQPLKDGAVKAEGLDLNLITQPHHGEKRPSP
jgi:hypothetical protein